MITNTSNYAALILLDIAFRFSALLASVTMQQEKGIKNAKSLNSTLDSHCIIGVNVMERQGHN